MSENTPGPWVIEVQPFGTAIAKDGVCIATAHGIAAITGHKLPHEANARLIASAPELAARIEAQAKRISQLEAALDSKLAEAWAKKDQRIAELEAALAASQKAIRELREQGAPCALWDDIEAANL